MGTSSKVDKDAIIFFDGVCNLCNGAINFIIDRDRKGTFKFAPLQSEFAKKRLQQSKIDPLKLDTIVLLEPRGNVSVKSTAALRIARNLSGAWPLLYGFVIIPKFIRDAVYNLIANNRYKWFGRTDQCRVPTPELLNRFIAE